MIRVSVTDLKSRLSEYLRRVKRGETLEVLERSVPIARIEAIRTADQDPDERVARLEREGVIRPPELPPDRSLLDLEPVPCRSDAVRALVEGRGDR
jgi:prevent-host-death family protein